MEDESNVVTTEKFQKEINVVQSCINRMAQNSFMIKGWAYTIIVALIALLSQSLCSLLHWDFRSDLFLVAGRFYSKNRNLSI